MKAGISAFSCLIVYLVVCTCKALENITVEVGQDVTLTCKVSNNNKPISAVKCSRPDQDPEYVLLVRDGHFDAHKQHPSYQNRVDLQDKEMKDGIVSLILKNVKKNDSGTYMCEVYQKETSDLTATKTKYNITLEVVLSGNKDGGDNTGIIVGAAVGVILLLVVLACVGFLIYRRLMKKNPNLPIRPGEAAAEQML